MKQLKRFYQLIWEKPGLFIFHVLALILAMILANTKPFFIGEITNLATGGQVGGILQMLIWFAVAMVVSSLLQNLAYYVQNINVARLSVKVMKKIMQKVHQLDFAFHANKSSGKLLSIFNRGDDAVFVFYESINDELLGVLVGFLMMMASFLQLNGRYALLVVVFGVLTMLLSKRILRANLRTRAIFNRADDELSAVKVDNLINFDTVKYFAKEKYEQKRLGEVLKRWYKTLLDYFVTFRIFDVAINNLATIFVLVIGVVAWFDLQAQAINVGEFLFVLTFTMNILPQMTYAMHVVRHLARKSDDLERYLGVLDETVTVPDPKPSEAREVNQVPGEIVFEGVSFAYHQQTPLLKDFDLRIAPGEAVALVGFSGAGKTTVAKLLMRMYDVDQGKITIDGVDLRQMNKDYLRSLVGIVPQEPLMFNNSVYYNIAYARPESERGEVLAAASSAQTDDFIEHLSDGYQTVVGERGIKLSGGQRQRLAIARVMLQGAGIVIFDEATSSLDSQAEKAVQQAFWTMVKDAGRPVTSIIIAHRLSTIMRADRIVVMDEGRIVEVGKHEQLLKKKKGIYARLWTLQQDGFLGDGE